MTTSGYAYIYPDGSIGVVTGAVPAPDLPLTTNQVNHILNYIGDSIAGHTVSDVEEAANAERDLQRRQCRGDLSQPALMEALCRRTARNLAMRGLPVGVMTTDMGGIRPALDDAEVRRLERPFRRGVVG